MIYLHKPNNFNPKFEVAGCFLERDGKFLLLLRQDVKPQGNTWGVPAGKIEDGETVVSAVCREIQEETGYASFEVAPEFLCTVFVRYSEYDFVYHMFSLRLDSEHTVLIDVSAHKDFRLVTPIESLRMSLMPDLDVCVKLFYGKNNDGM